MKTKTVLRWAWRKHTGDLEVCDKGVTRAFLRTVKQWYARQHGQDAIVRVRVTVQP